MGNVKNKALLLGLVLINIVLFGCGTIKSQNPEILQHYKINQEFMVGNQSFLISDIKTTQKIERTTYITKQTNNLFVVMRVKVTNNGEQTQTYEPNLFKIKDTKGRVFLCSDESDFYLNSHSYFFFKPISPDETKIADIFFEIPLNAQGLILEVSSGSEESNGEYVELGDVITRTGFNKSVYR